MPKGKKKKNGPTRELIYPEWDLQPNERGEDYALFTVYLRLGKNRSLAGTVRAIGYDPKSNWREYKKELNRIGYVCQRWEWTARRDLYEAFIVKDALDQEIKNRKEMNKRLAEHAMAAEAALMTPIKRYLEKYNSKEINFDKLTDSQLFALVARAVEKLTSIGEFERKVRGEPSEIIQQENKNINLNANYENLTHEELVQKAKELGFERKL